MMNQMRKLRQSNSGETLIEMIISIAIFALMVGTLSSAFLVSQNVISNNFDTRNEMNTKVIYVNEATIDNAESKGLKTSRQQQIIWSVDSGTQYNFKVQKIKDEDGTIEKYVNVTE